MFRGPTCGHGYDYWALGHVHHRAVLHEDPWIVYPGNLQGRHVREIGAKGCSVVQVEDGRIIGHEFRACDVVRWERIEIDLAGLENLDDLDEAVSAELERTISGAAGRPAIVRVRLSGASPLHDVIAHEPDRIQERVRGLAGAAGEVWTEKIVIASQSLARDDAAADELLDFRAAIRRELAGLRENSDALEDYRSSLKQIATSAAKHLDLRADDAERMRGLLDRVETRLLSALGDLES